LACSHPVDELPLLLSAFLNRLNDSLSYGFLESIRIVFGTGESLSAETLILSNVFFMGRSVASMSFKITVLAIHAA